MRSITLIMLGIALLIYGIFILRYGLTKLFFYRIHSLLGKLTLTPLRGMMLGISAAAVMQSSTAVSLITIGLVSAQYISFYQGLGIILGANIGTCSTVQLMTLALPEQYFFPLLAVTFIIAVLSRNLRYPALAAGGLISMFTGLSFIADALSTIAKVEKITEYVLIARNHPLHGILAGILTTVLFQSSSAATGLLMQMAKEGVIDIMTSVYVIYGNNIGSCLSSVFASIAAPLAAKRVAAAHVLLNIFGAMAFMPFSSLLAKTAAYITADFASQVAVMHTLFNIISSLVLFPAARQYAWLISKIIPGEERFRPK